LQQIEHSLQDPKIWNQISVLQALNKERVQLSHLLENFQKLTDQLNETTEWLVLAQEAEEVGLLENIETDLAQVERAVSEWELKRLFPKAMDTHAAFLEIQAGSGGVDAQDWAEMLLRLYLRWGERRGFRTELTELTAGDVAGIKRATVYFKGEYAYGWLRTETGVHRLVRLSPFDSNKRRHTAFAAVFVLPEVAEDIELVINPAEIRIDTYRASGAGGQHVQKTDSAVRIHHLPTGIIVQCQSDRSQHRNREQAMRQLRAKLYEREQRKRQAEQDIREAGKQDIEWGSQIRSYILDDARVKDLRTGVETTHVQAVLDGEIDHFLKASLEQGC
jgi:peptide chain release factor 2